MSEQLDLIVAKVLEESPYTSYTYPAQNDAVERDRASRYAIMIAKEVMRRSDRAALIATEPTPGFTSCPFTRRPFFMWIEHPELGRIPTYGGPFDSYSIPIPDQDDEQTLRCERYDHDSGDWIEGGEPLPLNVVSNDEFVELHELRDSKAALIARVESLSRQLAQALERNSTMHNDRSQLIALAKRAAKYLESASPAQRLILAEIEALQP